MRRISISLVAFCGVLAACTSSSTRDGAPPPPPSRADPDLVAFIGGIRAVDNHTHANSVASPDPDSDALPLDPIAPFEVPAPLLPTSSNWIAAYKALYKYPHDDLSDAHLNELRATMKDVAKAQGDKFPTWVLDQVGTEVMLANRVAMGPGLAPPRFRWVSFADPLLFPLTTTAEAATTPDRQKLFPMEDKLLQRYMADLKVAGRPATLDAYLKTVVTPTLEGQKNQGCVAVKFEAAYLRSLDFGEVPLGTASAIYAKYVGGGVPSRAEYKALQDFLFWYIAAEAGRLGMAVHIHSFEGAGNYFQIAGADPMLLESVFNDPALRNTNFVIIHGGGVYAARAGALLWKPNVYVDASMLPVLYPPSRLAGIFRSWLAQYPEKVLFGSDASAFGPDAGWELTAWIGGHNARSALATALSDMIREGEVTKPRAQDIARMVMRANAAKLYKLALN